MSMSTEATHRAAAGRHRAAASRTRTAASLAALFVGQVRSFREPRVRSSIRLNLLDSLCPRGSVDCTIELFLCGGLGYCQNKHKSKTQQPPLISRSEYSEMVANFSVGMHVAHVDWPRERCTDQERLRCSSRETRWCTGPKRKSCDSGRSRDPDSDATLLRNAPEFVRVEEEARSMFGIRVRQELLGLLRLRGCVARIEGRESARGFGFDWVLVARFDVGYFAPVMPLATYLKQDRGGLYLPANIPWGLSDHWALLPRRFAEIYGDAISQLCCYSCWRLSPTLPWEELPAQAHPLLIGMDPNGPEALLGTQLFVHGVRLLPGYVPWVIVRYTLRTVDLVRQRHTGEYVAAECARHVGCNYTRRGEDGEPIPRPHFSDSPIWPACPDQVARLAACATHFGHWCIPANAPVCNPRAHAPRPVRVATARARSFGWVGPRLDRALAIGMSVAWVGLGLCSVACLLIGCLLAARLRRRRAYKRLTQGAVADPT